MHPVSAISTTRGISAHPRRDRTVIENREPISTEDDRITSVVVEDYDVASSARETKAAARQTLHRGDRAECLVRDFTAATESHPDGFAHPFVHERRRGKGLEARRWVARAAPEQLIEIPQVWCARVAPTHQPPVLEDLEPFLVSMREGTHRHIPASEHAQSSAHRSPEQRVAAGGQRDDCQFASSAVGRSQCGFVSALPIQPEREHLPTPESRGKVDTKQRRWCAIVPDLQPVVAEREEEPAH